MGLPQQPSDKPENGRRISPPIILLLIAVIVAGVYFRFVGLDWDAEQHLHPDERFLTMVTSAIQPPKNLGEYFNSQTSTLNPYNNNFGLYVYGDLPIFITRYLAGFLDDLCRSSQQFCVMRNDAPITLSDYGGVYLLGRALSALLDVFTLVFMFLIGRRLYDTRTGLLAAALGAATVLQIQQAHFYTADTIATFFVVACMFFVIRLLDTFSWVDTIAGGISGGLAVASRINVAPILGILALAALVHVVSRWRDPQRKATFDGAIARIIVAAIVSVIVFRIFMPYAFNGLVSFDDRWSSNMNYIRALVAGDDPGGPPGVQWTNRTAIVFPWINIVFWGMGLPLGLTAWISWAWAGWQTFVTPYRKNRRGKLLDWIIGIAQSRHLLIWVWVTLYFVWQGSQWVKSIRYQLPIYPFLTMLAAAGLIALWKWLTTGRGRAPVARRLIGGSIIGAVLVGTYAWAFAFTSIYTQPTTRIAASRWIYDNIPTAVSVQVHQNGAVKQIQLPFLNSTTLPAGAPVAAPFRVDQESTLDSATIQRLLDTAGDLGPETVRVTISAAPDGSRPLAQAEVTANVGNAGVRGGSYTFKFNPVTLQPKQDYYAILTSASGAPLTAESSTLANEAWDDPIPLRVDGRDGFSQYHGIEMAPYDPDDPQKLGKLLNWLDSTDYVMMTSNRLYASIPRMPDYYPLTSEYYRLMLNGDLGFKLAAVFESYPTLGPFTFPDQETTQALGIWPDPTRCPQSGQAQCRGLINVPMPPAEEAFSVYDHPRVLVFQKTPQFDIQKVQAQLGRVDMRNWQPDATPRSETAAPNGLMLSDQAWQAQQETGTWSDLFDPNSILNQAPLLGAVAWYLVVALLGVLAFPILFAVVPGLRDRGYGVARVAGLLVVSFVVWLSASLHVIPFTRATILLSIIAFGVVGGIAAWRNRAALRSFWRDSRRILLIEEALFAVAFVFFLFVRFGNPDLWHPYMGGEKPMDFAYLNAVIKSQYFPPFDPWFAGGYISYYYYGFVLVAVLIKLTGIVPSIAYNFTIPTLFAMTALGAFCAAYNLVQLIERKALRDRQARYWLGNPIVIGVIAAVFVTFMGNLGEAQLIQQQIGNLNPSTINTTIQPVKQIADTAQGLRKMIFDGAALDFRPEWWYFTPTREIPAPQTEAGPISEFPYFTFLYADLHAHMIALPLTLLMLTIAVSWLKHPPAWSWGGVGSIVLGGLVAGALRPTNTWDYPTYLLIGTAALFFGSIANEPPAVLSTWVHFILRAAGFVLVGVVAFIPFTRNYATAYSSVELWQGSLTPIWAYLNIHLLFLFPIVTFIVWEIRRWGWRWWRALWNTLLRHWRWAVVLAAVAFVIVVLLVFRSGREVFLVAAPIMLLCGLLIIRPRLAVAYRFWYFIVLMSIALTFVVEVVVLKGDISRMNTTFKFYMQVWVLLGISAAVALGWLADRLANWTGWGAWLWKGSMAVLAAAAFLYVPLATRGKMTDRFVTSMPPGFNGTDYMLEAKYEDNGQQYELKWDHAAIAWLQDNVQGSPVVAEANTPLYRWGSRIAINTGLPSIVGWDWHQHQQRSALPGSVVDNRLNDVRTLYDAPDKDVARSILDRYNVRYIVVGDLERAYYAPEGLRKFDEMVTDGSLRVAYQNEGTKIYEVMRGTVN